MDWIVHGLVALRRFRIARELLVLLVGADIPGETTIGPRLTLKHRGMGVVLHPNAVLGADVTLYHQVTIGRAGVTDPGGLDGFEGVEIGDGVVIGAGAKILGSSGVLRVGNGCIIGANSVLTSSTSPHEVWAGVPAVRLRSLAESDTSR